MHGRGDLAHIFKLGDPFSSVINILLIVAIVAAARVPGPEAEAMTSLHLHDPRAGLDDR